MMVRTYRTLLVSKVQRYGYVHVDICLVERAYQEYKTYLQFKIN